MIQARHANGYFKPDPIYQKDMETVTAQICEYFGLTVEALRSKTRKREIVIARHIAMYFCEENGLGSLKSIGIFFGGRDHSTVIHALRSVEDDVFTDAKFKNTVEEIRKLLKEGKDLRYKYFPEDNLPKEMVEVVESYKEVENQL